MTLTKVKNRERLDLYIILIVAAILSMFSISIHFIDKLYSFFDAYTNLPLAEFLTNLSFLSLVGLLWITYIRWRKAVKRQEELEKIISSISPDVLLVINPDRTIAECNESLERMFGYQVDEIINKKTDFLYFNKRSTKSDQEDRREIHDILERNGFHIGLATGKKKNGETIPLEIITGNLSDRSGVVQLLRDITERKQAEEELHKAYDHLEKRVRARTAELEHANQTLKAEITERKRVEERLRESEERYKTLVQTSNDMIFMVDLKGSFLFTNRAFERILGYKSEEIKRINGFEPVHPDDLETVREQFAQLVGGKSVDNMEYRYKVKSGSYISILNNASPILDSKGNVVAALGVARDITERKQAEEELRKYRDHLEELVEERTAELTKTNQQLELQITERKRAEGALQHSEKKYRGLFNQARDGIVLIDLETGHIIDCNPEFENQTGRNLKQLKEMKIWELRPPEKVEMAKKKYVEIREKGAGGSNELEFQKPNGKVVHVDFVSKVVKIQDKEYVQSIVRDISERKRVEEVLRETNARLETLIQAIPDIVYVKDVQGRNLVVNKAYEEFVNLQQAQIVGRPDEEVLPPSLTLQCQLSDDEVISKGKSIRCEEHSKREDGQEIFFETIKVPLYDEAGKLLGLVGVSRDITERKRAEENLKKAKEEAEEANRLKSEFLANMSHEIRTPMNAIIGMTDLTLDTELTDEQRDYLTTAKYSTRALLELLNDILDLSKIEADRIELENIDFDLRTTIEGISDTLAHRASSKGLELACMIHHQVPSLLRGDPSRLRQILMNLGGNAIKFTERGEVVIGVELDEETEDRTTLLFSVTDTGIGIPKDNQTKIFASFTQADGSTTRRFGGTGLGLAISKRLVELLGGKIGVESEPGKGSRFWFTAIFKKQKELKDIFPSVPPNIRGMRMLVVDDNRTNRTILVKMLESFGCCAESAETGTEALQMLKRAAHKEKLFDLVLLDMQMPEMDGEETLRAIKDDSKIKDVVVIILTSIGERGDAKRLEALGCAGYLLKPVKQSQLFDAIITVMSRQKTKNKEKPGSIVTRHTIEEQKRRRVRILLAEDNPMNQKVAVALLKRVGYSVDAVEDGRMVLEALNRTVYDLILLDVQMPEMDGFETAQAIRARKDQIKHTPIVAMTAHAMKGDRERCLQAGMDDYISKPIEPQHLLEIIKKWISSSDRPKVNTRLNNFEKGGHFKAVPIDFETALNRFDGDKDFFEKILDEFLNSAPKQLKILDKAIEKGNAKMIEEEAHSIKGAAANLSVNNMAELSLKLELMGRVGDLNGAEGAMRDLKTEFKLLEEYIHQTFKLKSVLKS